MISCTEFIPLYSEFFKYLDKKGGYDAVLAYWHHISDTSLGDSTNPHSMVSFIEKRIAEGHPHAAYQGAKDYWGHTTTEEACDTRAVVDPEHPYSYSEMFYCPSRAILNDFQHITPYEHYCEHCKIVYSRVLEKYGVSYERDHSLVHLAQCNSVLFETKNPPPADYKEEKEGRKVTRRKREGLKYLHRDFHLLGDNALRYCADKFGEAALIEFLRHFAGYYFAPIIDDAKNRGLIALKEWLEKIYLVEEASEVLHTELTGDTLTVTVDKCPVIAYARSLNQELSPYYIEQTRTLYDEIAKSSGFTFTLEEYDEDGKARFTFAK